MTVTDRVLLAVLALVLLVAFSLPQLRDPDLVRAEREQVQP